MVVAYDRCVSFVCREQQKKLVDAELDLAAARSQGYVSINKTTLGSRKTVVIGIFTSFGGQTRRTASRKDWVPTGTCFILRFCFVILLLRFYC